MTKTKFEDTYQYTSKTGDIVLMPNGTVGIITDWDIVGCGHCKEVQVHPLCNFLYRFWLIITLRTWYYDGQINRLKPLILAQER